MQLKNSKICFTLILVLAAALLLAGCGGGGGNEGNTEDQGEDKLNVAFMYVGPAGDAGWTYAHDQARKYLNTELDYVVAEDYVENVAEGAEAATVLTQLAEKGNDVIFSTSFGFMDYTIDVAKKYPDKTFLHCSGYKTADNVGTYFGRMYQSRYLTGLAAGKATETDLIGYVAAFPIPEVIRGINGFTLGVKEANPDAEVKVIWTNTWYDPSKEKDAAKALLDSGADVIAQHQDTPGPQQAAQEAGAYSVGYNTDMSKFAPEAVLTSAVWNWRPYYADTVEAVENGTWEPNQYWGSLADGIVDIAPFGPMVADETKELVKQWRDKIESGEWDVFYGPLKDQSGKIRVEEGQQMTDDEILNMDWFVEGVNGKLESSE